jgi:rfaE bifunctional protein nucleotidyltransferase chain/domain
VVILLIYDNIDFKSSKIKNIDEIKIIIEDNKKLGKKSGLCVGGYDLMHPGHIKHIESAKSNCDCLIIGITADKFNSKRKGNGRPIFNENLRAYSIASLDYVDYVFISDYEKAVEVIKIIKPDYYIKGPDYKNKNTPGITSEREAIRNVGGEIVYTQDIKLSTSELIRYIKDNVDEEKNLVILDRDGTLIENADFLGQHDDWKKDFKLRYDVLDMIKSYKNAVYIVVTNQGGVSRKLFDEKRVQEINEYLDLKLKEYGINVSNWQYCPYGDKSFYDAHKGLEGYEFDMNYIKETSGRKPSVQMVEKALSELNLSREEFDNIVVFGDSEDDLGLAKNLSAKYIDVSKN